MSIKSNSLDPRDPRREFVLENAGERKIDYDRELYELLGEQSSLVASVCLGEITKLLRFSKDISDEDRAEKLREILCNSNDGELVIGQKVEKVLETIGLTEEKLEMAKQLIQGRINLEIRSRVTSLLNKLDCIADGSSRQA